MPTLSSKETQSAVYGRHANRNAGGGNRSHHADVCVVTAFTDKSKGAKAVSAVVIEKETC
jgi:hypothetical protein